MIKVLDLFSSNGSTWFDKTFFERWAVKNDIRDGDYKIANGKQTLTITPNIKVNIFDKQDWELLKIQNWQYSYELARADVIYLDPPHCLQTTGIMNEKYTHLPKNWVEAISNMWWNVNKLAKESTTTILKWNANEIPLKSILDLAKQNRIEPLFGDRTKTKTYWVVLRKILLPSEEC